MNQGNEKAERGVPYHKKWLRRLAWLLFIVYMTVLIYFLFFSENYGRTTNTSDFRYNLVLFAEIRRFIRYRRVVGFTSFAVNVLGNVVAFMPFGFVLPMLHHSHKSFWYVLVTGFEFSLLVEVVQLIARVGIFDVDDILLNTVGTALGYLFYVMVHKAYVRVRKGRVNVSKKGRHR